MLIVGDGGFGFWLGEGVYDKYIDDGEIEDIVETALGYFRHPKGLYYEGLYEAIVKTGEILAQNSGAGSSSRLCSISSNSAAQCNTEYHGCRWTRLLSRLPKQIATAMVETATYCSASWAPCQSCRLASA